ncbi:MAG: fibronectin type III domain-containing protein [Actinomycetes bacterium]
MSFTSPAATAVAPQRVALKVLVLTNSTAGGNHNASAIATQLGREGVPYENVDLATAGRPTIDQAFLESADGTGKYQGVVLVNRSGAGLSASELDALAAYEVRYGVRQINGYDWPGDAKGFGAATPGAADGGTVQVTAAGSAAGFGYLRGELTVDDFDPNLAESWAGFAPIATDLPPGATATPLLTMQKGDATGVLAGVYSEGGREELTFTAAFNPGQQWWNSIAHGVVTWLTRGVHLGYQRNYLAVQVDDIFLPDGRWSIDGNCTPGDNCVDPNIKTTDIRMTVQDVDHLVAWQNSHGFKLDMVFNAAGTQLPEHPNDPLTARFLQVQQEFPWINHTWSHPYLGCIQIAPTVQGQPWHCATQPNEEPRQDDEIPEAADGGIYWASKDFLKQQIQQNIDWATKTHHLTDFDASEIVTGEHSGLLSLPEQERDNPFLAPALEETGVKVLASDASRENAPRAVGSAVTVPRHPMNIFYNAGTYQDQIDEYNWIYNSRDAGGSGICNDFPATTTCIPPLKAGTNAEAKESFESYLVPMEVRNALRFVLTNDPRPFYAHQSNLAEDKILYPVVEGVLNHYRATFDESSAPLVRLDLTGQSKALERMDAWDRTKDSVNAYVDATGVHVAGAPGQAVPLTVPGASTGTPAELQPYGGELSGWISGPATATPPTPGAGYLPAPPATVPGAPVIGQVTAGNASATVAWSAPVSDGGAPVTGYRIDAFTSTSDQPAATGTATSPGDTSLRLDGLTNGTAYTFTVTATNTVGDGPASERSAPVTPMTVPDAPVIGTASAGDASASVSWSAPASNGGSALTGYTVLAHPADGGAALRTDVPADATTAQVTSLTNGTTYTFTVTASNAAGSSPESASSNSVTPAAVVPPATVPGAPEKVSATAGNATATVTWTAPATDGGSAVTGYLVRAYAAGSDAPVTTVIADSTSVPVTGLENGKAHTFDVVAVNAAGEGPASARSDAVTPSAPATAPSAPAAPEVAAGDARVTASWTAPDSDGGSPLTGYVVTAYAGSDTKPAASVTTAAGATRADVPGLKNGTAYTVTVKAVNAVGSSPESARSVSVTPQPPATVPAAPAAPNATAGNASATVTWKAPARDGGSPLTGYVVTAYAGSNVATTQSVGAAETSALVTGLTNGTSYRFTVRAVNVVGQSPESAKSSAVTPKVVKTAPSAPLIGSASAGRAAATVTWAPPTTDGGSKITGYVVTVTPATGKAVTKSASASATSLTVTGLTPGTSYTFSVAARNTVGTGPKSASSDAVVPTALYELPGAPTIGTVKTGSRDATVTWTAPASDGGARISGYVVTVYPEGGKAFTKKAGGSAKSLKVTGLSQSTQYTFTVAATNKADTGPASDRSNTVQPGKTAGSTNAGVAAMSSDVSVAVDVAGDGSAGSGSAGSGNAAADSVAAASTADGQASGADAAASEGTAAPAGTDRQSVPLVAENVSAPARDETAMSLTVVAALVVLAGAGLALARRGVALRKARIDQR